MQGILLQSNMDGLQCSVARACVAITFRRWAVRCDDFGARAKIGVLGWQVASLIPCEVAGEETHIQPAKTLLAQMAVPLGPGNTPWLTCNGVLLETIHSIVDIQTSSYHKT